MTLLQKNLGLRTLHYVIITVNQQEISALHPSDKEGYVVAHTGNPVTWETPQDFKANLGNTMSFRPVIEKRKKRMLFVPCGCGEALGQHFFKKLV